METKIKKVISTISDKFDGLFSQIDKAAEEIDTKINLTKRVESQPSVQNEDSPIKSNTAPDEENEMVLTV